MAERRYVEDVLDEDGYIVEGGYTAWECQKCKGEVRRYWGQGDVSCQCGAQYNACGQRLRDDWRDNLAWRDDSVGDLEGFEIASLRREGAL